MRNAFATATGCEAARTTRGGRCSNLFREDFRLARLRMEPPCSVLGGEGRKIRARPGGRPCRNSYALVAMTLMPLAVSVHCDFRNNDGSTFSAVEKIGL